MKSIFNSYYLMFSGKGLTFKKVCWWFVFPLFEILIAFVTAATGLQMFAGFAGATIGVEMFMDFVSFAGMHKKTARQFRYYRISGVESCKKIVRNALIGDTIRKMFIVIVCGFVGVLWAMAVQSGVAQNGSAMLMFRYIWELLLGYAALDITILVGRFFDDLGVAMLAMMVAPVLVVVNVFAGIWAELLSPNSIGIFDIVLFVIALVAIVSSIAARFHFTLKAAERGYYD